MAFNLRRATPQRLRRAFPLALLLGAAAWSTGGSACTLAPVIFVTGDPPAHLTDPDDIEEWRRQQEEASDAYRMAATEQQWRAYMAQLALEAAQAQDLAVGRLTKDLTVALVPPLLPQLARRDSCGSLWGPEVRDPAGYLERDSSRGNLLLADHLVMLGVIENSDEIRFVPARLLRDLTSDSSCLSEARDRVQRMLEERFSSLELAHVWSTLHRLDFNFNAVESASKPDIRFEPRVARVLAFTDGRSGPLEFSKYTKPIGFSNASSPLIWRGQKADTAKLGEFLNNDPVAVRMVDEIERALADEGLDRCPATAAEIARKAAELRPQIEDRRDRRRRP